jgi:hypothetical protein
MCPIVPFCATLSVNVSIITLVAISLDRYYVILHPFKEKLQLKQCILVLIIIWIVSIGLALFKIFNFSVHETNHVRYCGPINKTVDKYENLSLFVAQYFIPLLVLAYTYSHIGFHIYFDDSPNSVTDQGKNKGKVIKMIFIVVLLFMICWLPLQIFNILNVTLDGIEKYFFNFNKRLLTFIDVIIKPGFDS